MCWPDKPRVRFPGLCTLTGHSGLVLSVAYSPDGKHIVSGSDGQDREGLGFSDGQGGECPTLSSPYRLLLRALC